MMMLMLLLVVRALLEALVLLEGACGEGGIDGVHCYCRVGD
jgi:hypothetical protein